MRHARSLMVAAGVLWAAPALAAGNTCADASEITALPFADTSTTCGAGDEFENDTGAAAVCTDLPRGYGGEDVFYKLTLGPGNRLAFDLTMPPAATGDLALFLVKQPSCAGPPVCAGNSVDLIGAAVGPERIKLQSYPAGTYYLIVDSALASPDPAQCGGYALAVTGHLSEFCGNGIVEAGELCDDGNNLDGDCCAADCKTKAAAGTTCRAAVGPCDAVEVCDGNGACPADGFTTANVCRPANGVCDLPEVCAGTGPLCPTDRVVNAGTPCRGSAGPCDQTEFCTGASPACPADQFRSVGTMCALATPCTQAAVCNGSAACPAAAAVSCNDNNACTADTCHPVAGCVHTPMCQDAGTDASPDTAPDVSPDVAGDTSADVGLTPDAPPLPRDTLPADAPAVDARTADSAPPPPPDAAADAPRSADGQVLADAAPGPDSAGGMMVGPATIADGGSVIPPDSGAIPGVTSDARFGDATQGMPPINKLTGDGCSCRLNASSYQGESGFGWLAIAVAAGWVIRRRRNLR